MIATRAVGTPLDRIDGPLKVTGAAKYAYEYPVEKPAYVHIVQSTIGKGRIASIDASEAQAQPGVVAVITHENAPRTEISAEDGDLRILQSDAVAYHGQIVAAVVAETLEIAQHAAGFISIRYEEQPHDVDLRVDRPDLHRPEKVNAGFATDTRQGDFEEAFRTAPIRHDATYTTPYYHNNPLEPHATVATWTDDGVTLYDANQGPHTIRETVATAFGLPETSVRVISPYVGGGFGSKAFAHSHIILAVMAAKMTRRPVKVGLTRHQMFSLVGYRTPTIQRIRLAAGADGKLTAIAHDVVELTSTVEEYAEQTAVATRMMYAGENRATTHRLAVLDVPTPTIFRAPGETPGMYALESAMDEMAIACGLDPVEFRIRNEPEVDPETKHPFSSRNLVACLREGARRFGWEGRNPTPRARRDGNWLIGTGVAASTYPTRRRPSDAAIRADADGTYEVLIDASDIGTGTWTALTQIAADALGVPVERVRLRIGDSALPKAPGAGGSMGIVSWGSAIVDAAHKLRAALAARHGGVVPADGLEIRGETDDNPELKQHYSAHAFGAQFAEVRVDADTGEVRVPRLLGVFAVGRMMNPKTGRSQLIGGMTMGISMALHEETVMDARYAHFANHDLAEYHIATNADTKHVEAYWVDEDDPQVNPMGAKGIGEIGMTGTAAAIANAVHHATGIRVRDLPITLDKLLTRGP
ncbi:MAG TPA: xanthine dehydrogenase family protein molybdopterin-binding subunit [Candidatus Limnocylindrales bacterium]|nr:xanthine dehydrogenase family protein molybdopterin-binding subunit [Candidatus Limnocylindrales bacterium]